MPAGSPLANSSSWRAKAVGSGSRIYGRSVRGLLEASRWSSALDRDTYPLVSSTEGAMNENVHRSLTDWDIRDYLDFLR
jgi:hypothetical protein